MGNAAARRGSRSRCLASAATEESAGQPSQFADGRSGAPAPYASTPAAARPHGISRRLVPEKHLRPRRGDGVCHRLDRDRPHAAVSPGSPRRIRRLHLRTSRVEERASAVRPRCPFHCATSCSAYEFTGEKPAVVVEIEPASSSLHRSRVACDTPAKGSSAEVEADIRGDVHELRGWAAVFCESPPKHPATKQTREKPEDDPQCGPLEPAVGPTPRAARRRLRTRLRAPLQEHEAGDDRELRPRSQPEQVGWSPFWINAITRAPRSADTTRPTPRTGWCPR